MDAQYTLDALVESNNLLQDMMGRYRRSNVLLRRINGELRRRMTVLQQRDETFKSECENPALVETYWGDPSGGIRRMGGEQETIAVATNACTAEEFLALSNIMTNMELKTGGLPAEAPSQASGLEQK